MKLVTTYAALELLGPAYRWKTEAYVDGEDPPIDNELFRPYNVVPDALLVNVKSLRFVFLPENDRVRVFVEPPLPGLEGGMREGMVGRARHQQVLQQRDGAPAQPEAAARAIAQWLTFKGIKAPELVLQNGSAFRVCNAQAQRR